MSRSRSGMAEADTAVLAGRLEAAWRERVPIAPFSETGELTTVEDAYATQQAWAALRAAEGETRIGRKIGLTSRGMQRQMGVAEPDFGDLWSSRRFDDCVFPSDVFIQPRVEGEVALLIGADLQGPGVSPTDVRAAARAAALAIEVVDSRIKEWRIALVDTIADNASYGGFACGAWSEQLLGADLPSVRFTLSRNGQDVVQETGAAVLGSPLSAVAWLVNKLAEFGDGVRSGDVVLSGSFGGAVRAAAGDEFSLRCAGEEPVSVRFTEVAR